MFWLCFMINYWYIAVLSVKIFGNYQNHLAAEEDMLTIPDKNICTNSQ
jgi:hypothetical protein